MTEGTTVSLTPQAILRVLYAGLALAALGCSGTPAGVDEQASTGLLGTYMTPLHGVFVAGFEQRDSSSGYANGYVLHHWSDFDATLGHTVKAEVQAQLEQMKGLGVNLFTFELRAADDVDASVPFDVAHNCPENRELGLLWPQPGATELANFVDFLTLVATEGMKINLTLTNTHMDSGSWLLLNTTWLSTILDTVKHGPHPEAVHLVSFGGDVHINGSGSSATCGIPAEAPLWLGPGSVPATYVYDAMNLALQRGWPASQLVAESIVGDAFTLQYMTDPLLTMKAIFNQLGVPDASRVYGLSFYEHTKCNSFLNRPVSCPGDESANVWARETFAHIQSVVGTTAKLAVIESGQGTLDIGNNKRLPLTTPTHLVVEDLFDVLRFQPQVESVVYWKWAQSDVASDTDPTLAEAVKLRGMAWRYTATANEVIDLDGFHVYSVPNGSFEIDLNLDGIPDNWRSWSRRGAERVLIDNVEVAGRGAYYLSLVNDTVDSKTIAVSPSTAYTLTARVQAVSGTTVFGIYFLDNFGGQVAPGLAFTVGAPTADFVTFPMRFTTPPVVARIMIEIYTDGTALVDDLH